MNNKIYLLRHFKTDNNHNEIISGQLDDFTILPIVNGCPENIVLELEKLKNIKIFTSTLKRCVDTIKCVVEKTSNPYFEINENLIERNFGDLQGLKREYAVMKYPHLFKNKKFIPQLTPPNGESLKEIEVRIIKLMQLIKTNKTSDIVFCSHNHFMKLFFTYYKEGNFSKVITNDLPFNTLIKIN